MKKFRKKFLVKKRENFPEGANNEIDLGSLIRQWVQKGNRENM